MLTPKRIAIKILLSCLLVAHVSCSPFVESRKNLYRAKLLENAQKLVGQDFSIYWNETIPSRRGNPEQRYVKMFKHGERTLTNISMHADTTVIPVIMHLTKETLYMGSYVGNRMDCFEMQNSINFGSVVNLVYKIVNHGVIQPSRFRLETEETLLQITYKDKFEYEFHFLFQNNEIIPYKHFVFYSRMNQPWQTEVHHIQVNENPDLSQVNFEVPPECLDNAVNGSLFPIY